MRHPGARGFAQSSAVEINLSVLGEVFDFFDEVVGFDADGTGDALGVGIVVTMAADIGDQHVLGRFGRQSAGKFLCRYARNDIQQPVLAVNPNAIAGIHDKSDGEDDLGGKTGRTQARAKIAKLIDMAMIRGFQGRRGFGLTARAGG